MLTLASMVMFAYAFVLEQMHMQQRAVPMPVVIEQGCCYAYNMWEDAIYIPDNWTDACSEQKMIIYEMATHFNNFRSPAHKFNADALQKIKDKWVCLQ